jgi:hypothetical protein
VESELCEMNLDATLNSHLACLNTGLTATASGIRGDGSGLEACDFPLVRPPRLDALVRGPANRSPVLLQRIEKSAPAEAARS